MDLATHIAALRRDGTELADAAQTAGLEASVPTCPDWLVRDLVAHVGGVHRWAASYITTARVEPYSDEQEKAFFNAPADAKLLAWFREGHAALVDALETADPDLVCYTFLRALSPREFWARRQAHETAVHRADAQFAAGVEPRFETLFAADGIGELFGGFLARRGRSIATDGPLRIAVRAMDADCAWTVTFQPDLRDRVVVPVAEPADLSLSGPAADLYLLLWNRGGTEHIEVGGDAQLLKRWREGVKITW
ncbi:MAG TPA: maleylpyruvate isomerase family mycothiol-dependent enzyme [Actinocrinis sp.]|uniref:maleylpyruvate isomerase family mycothiol-dependent enzyme n=1 Tax=Actinocrinis sp. TaxID=1920516 RepID=UPI002DDD851C|nr:maleylpyruvate isomerase family mycothiol-dependent enzyme [Actinocrinis sp.]HEV3168861.1 maleylpyruvate isomerase family mycothiol-dependent enzyme [Actinocrinis sp.]